MAASSPEVQETASYHVTIPPEKHDDDGKQLSKDILPNLEAL